MSERFKIILGVITFLAIGCVLLYKKQKAKHIFNNPAYNTACVVLVAGNVVYEFEYMNKVYRGSNVDPFSGIKPKECFKMVFDKMNPDNSYLAFDQPIIPIDFYETKEVMIDDIFSRKIRFSYLVNGVKYTRFQKLEQSLDLDRLTLILVKYKCDDPEIGYIGLPPLGDDVP